MAKHYLIIDESGSKGYSKKPEQSDGELGVMTGFLIPDEQYDFYKEKFESGAGTHNHIGKRHITDIPVELQEANREQMFEVFRTGRIFWFYEAIFTHGLYESEFLEHRGGSKNGRELLHAKLFMGVMAKAFACLYKFRSEQIELVVISDPIDRGVIKSFERELSPYLALLHGLPIENEFTSFNREAQEVEEYSIVSSISPKSDVPKFHRLNVNIICEESAMTYAADILANCTNFHIKRNFMEGGVTKLNSIQAISGHPLEDLVMHTYDGNDDAAWQPSDVVYRRNKDKPTA